MNYGEVISAAFRIAWRNKFLWVFGFFIAGGGSIVTPSNFGTPPQAQPTSSQPPAWLANLGRWVTENGVLAVVIAAAVFLALVLFFVAVGALCQGALISSVVALDRGEDGRFSSAWRAGVSNFWRVLSMVLIIALISLLLFVALSAVFALVVFGLFFGALPAVDSSAARAIIIVLGILLLLLAAVLFIVVSFAIGIVAQYALRDRVLERGGIRASIVSGYRLFRRNLGKSVLLMLIQFGIGFAVAIVLFIATTVAGLLISIPVTALTSAGSGTAAVVVVTVVSSLIVSVPLFILSGALGTFNHSYWTLAYLRLKSLGREPETPPQPDAPTVG